MKRIVLCIFLLLALAGEALADGCPQCPAGGCPQSAPQSGGPAAPLLSAAAGAAAAPVRLLGRLVQRRRHRRQAGQTLFGRCCR